MPVRAAALLLRLLRTTRPWLLHGLVASAAAACLVWLAPPGVDVAAHVYQRATFLAHGFQLWNNYWYAGRYSFVSYSLLYYPAAGLLGIKLLAVLTTGVAAGAFAKLIGREWPTAGPWPARASTVIVPATVITGAFPYALGLALALLATVCLRPMRLKRFSLFTILAFAASPLAFVLLFVVLVAAAAVGRRSNLAAPAGVVIAVGCLGALLQRLFPGGGSFPFPAAGLAATLAFCVVGLCFTVRIASARMLSCFFAVYGVAALLAFAIPSAIGENITRLRFIALPLAVLAVALRHWRPVVPAVCAVLLAGAWNITPLAFGAARATNDASSKASYWKPAIAYLQHRVGASYRVEAVDTAGHWAALYLPRAGIPIARGWYRQDDFPTDALLYRPLAAHSYLAWLRGLGVKYVVLTDAPSDYSSIREAALVGSGRLPLRRVFWTAHLRIYKVPQPTKIVTGAPEARVVRFSIAAMTLALPKRGVYRVSVRYSPYWTASAGCISRGVDGMIRLAAARPSRVELRFSVTPQRVLEVGIGMQVAACAGRRRA